MTTKKRDIVESFIKDNRNKINHQYKLNYHLTGEYGWINDPNGFIQYKGEYHLFYQFHPYDALWGPMHWGHAVSKDLVKWSYLPIALVPEENYDKDGCFSGTSIEKDDGLYLMYTGHVNTEDNGVKSAIEVQCLAYSKDGVNFDKLKDNPVINTDKIPEAASKRDFRDPKVFKDGDNYHCIIGSNDGNSGQTLLYKSTDLIHWNFVNVAAKGNERMGINWECPDIFSLQERDVLIVSPQYMKAQENDFNNLHSSVYVLGKLQLDRGIFDFNEFYQLDYGFDFYAPQTTIDDKGRRILIAWMDMWENDYPTERLGHNWAGAMTLPREVALKDDRLYFNPVSEIEKHRKNELALDALKLNGEEELQCFGVSYELQICFDAGRSSEFGLKIRASDTQETSLCYNTEDKLFRFNRDKSGIGPKGERRTKIDLINNKLTLRIFVDKSSVEVFINNGEKVMTGRIYPNKDAVKIKTFSKGECSIDFIKMWEL